MKTSSHSESTSPLPRAMQQHTYGIMSDVEESHWWFVGRRRILESVMERAIARIHPAPARPRLLDVGCGTGGNLLLLQHFGEAHGVDVSEDALAFCRQRGLTNVTLGTAEALPYDDASFDVVTALDVVEHLDDDAACLREMARVLKPGGSAVFFVPAFQWLWGVQDDVSHHRRRYTLPQIEARVRDAGLRIEMGTYANITFFAPILAGRLLMKVTGLRPKSENNINVSALNGVFGRLFASERHWIARGKIPFGVSAIVIASKG